MSVRQGGGGRVLAVAEWHPNVDTDASERFYRQFRTRFPTPRDDHVFARMQVMIEMLAAAMESAGSTDAAAVARALEGMTLAPGTLGGFHEGTMRVADHQFIQPLYVSVMAQAGTPGLLHDDEGSGSDFGIVRYIALPPTEQPTTCRMVRP